MRGTARLYVTSIVVAGSAIGATAIINWQTSSMSQFLTYIVLAAVASTRKIRLPGITGTYSLSFLFILLGITNLTFPETIAIGCVAAVIQSVWNPTVRPKAIQILFNVGNIVVSIDAAFFSAKLLVQQASNGSAAIVVAFAASLFFISNTFLVSVAISLTDGQPLQKIWSQWILWSVPYYLTGTAVAALINVSNQQLGWRLSLLCLPLMYLASMFYQLYMDTHASRPAEPSI